MPEVTPTMPNKPLAGVVKIGLDQKPGKQPAKQMRRKKDDQAAKNDQPIHIDEIV